MSGSHIGGMLGREAGEAAQPTSMYRKIINSLSPYERGQLRDVIPALIRGAQAGKFRGLGALPETSVQAL